MLVTYLLIIAIYCIKPFGFFSLLGALLLASSITILSKYTYFDCLTPKKADVLRKFKKDFIIDVNLLEYEIEHVKYDYGTATILALNRDSKYSDDGAIIKAKYTRKNSIPLKIDTLKKLLSNIYFFPVLVEFNDNSIDFSIERILGNEKIAFTELCLFVYICDSYEKSIKE